MGTGTGTGIVIGIGIGIGLGLGLGIGIEIGIVGINKTTKDTLIKRVPSHNNLDWTKSLICKRILSWQINTNKTTKKYV